MIHKDPNGRDYRYDLIPALIQDGRILVFADIFTYIPKTVFMGDIHMGAAKFNRLIQDPGSFRVKDMIVMEGLFGVPLVVLCGLALQGKEGQKV